MFLLLLPVRIRALNRNFANIRDSSTKLYYLLLFPKFAQDYISLVDPLHLGKKRNKKIRHFNFDDVSNEPSIYKKDLETCLHVASIV